MSHPKVLVISRPLASDVLSLFDELRSEIDLRVVDKDQPIDAHLPETEVLYGALSPEQFSQARRLRWVQHPSTGVDNMLFEAFVRSDVVLTSMGGAFTETVADHAMALLLAIVRRLHVSRDRQHEKQWRMVWPDDLAGMTLGIIGFGRIGRAVAERAAAFGMDILALDLCPADPPPPVRRVDPLDRLDSFLAECRAIVCALPRTGETRGLLGREQFAAMPDGAYVVNIGRGGAMDETALVEALRAGKLAAAGIDVTEQEPCPPDSPLWSEPGVLLTPHSAGFSRSLDRRRMQWFVENLKRYLRDEPLEGVVDKARGW